MTAKVDILANELTNVVYVPMQAVAPFERKQVCYVLHGRSTERREVEVGDFNDEFIEIKSGLKEGEAVVLQPPETPAHEKPEEAPDKPAPKGPAVVAPGPQASLGGTIRPGRVAGIAENAARFQASIRPTA